MNKLIAPMAAFALAAAPLAACGPRTQNGAPPLLRQCPDEWIINRMPRIVAPGDSAAAEQYYILGGRRRELREFDTKWIEKNCDLRATVVH